MFLNILNITKNLALRKQIQLTNTFHFHQCQILASVYLTYPSSSECSTSEFDIQHPVSDMMFHLIITNSVYKNTLHENGD